MATTWVLVAESARARLFRAESPAGGLHEIEDFVHPEARMHDQELTTDKPGRGWDEGGTGRHGFDPEPLPKGQEADKFARRIAEYLDKARVQDEFHRLHIVAPPKFLGLLRSHLSDGTSPLVIQALDKDLVRERASDIRKHLPHRL